MIINGDTFEHMERDVATVLDVSAIDFRKAVKTAMRNASEKKRDPDWRVFRNWSQDYIHKHRREDVTAVYVCHLTRMIEKSDILLPLPTLLTGNNAFSNFLLEHGIAFSFCDNKLILRYNGKLIDPASIYNPRDARHKHSGLALRLGYFGNRQDFCVNGFSFAAGIENDLNGYFKSLAQGPELLMRLDYFLGTNLRHAYEIQSKYYIAYIKANWSDVVFDSYENIKTAGEKELFFLEKCIEHLAEYYENGSGMGDIPILRFKDTDCVEVEYYQEIDNSKID